MVTKCFCGTSIHFHTQSDGTDLGSQIASMVFELLDMSPEERPVNLDSALDETSIYVNGDLFRDHLPIVFGNSDVRTYLLEACRFILGDNFTSHLWLDVPKCHDTGRTSSPRCALHNA